MAIDITLGFSPCPNDTFIFDGMVNGGLDTGDFHFNSRLEDVETLNRWALQARLPVTKMSFSTFLQVSDQYRLLDCGSALGEGVGPLLLARTPPPADPEVLRMRVQNGRVAIPGWNTTAHLLFSMEFPEVVEKKEFVFSQIEDAVSAGEVDFGLVIHESRFTYADKGLYKWMDMGDWWQHETGVPIPLGGICVRKDVPAEDALQIQQILRRSLALSWERYPALTEFITTNAREMDEKVMRQHIDLYVNEYSRSLGRKGKAAIEKLFAYARRAAWPVATEKPIFV